MTVRLMAYQTVDLMVDQWVDTLADKMVVAKVAYWVGKSVVRKADLLVVVMVDMKVGLWAFG